jgi:hypothetical protein
MSSFENRAAVFVWDALRLGRRRRSQQLALFYVFALFFQTVNAWVQWLALNAFLQNPTYAFWGPPILADLLQGHDWQVAVIIYNKLLILKKNRLPVIFRG